MKLHKHLFVSFIVYRNCLAPCTAWLQVLKISKKISILTFNCQLMLFIQRNTCYSLTDTWLICNSKKLFIYTPNCFHFFFVSLNTLQTDNNSCFFIFIPVIRFFRKIKTVQKGFSGNCTSS